MPIRNRKNVIPEELRKSTADSLRSVRGMDHGFHSNPEYPDRIMFSKWLKRRGITEFNKNLFHQKKGIQTVIEKLLERRENPRVLDLGCGDARLLYQLSVIFPGKLDLHGLTLAKPSTPTRLEEIEREERSKRTLNREEENNLKLAKRESRLFWKRTKEHNIDVHTGLAETYNYNGRKFDLIVSSASMVHAIDNVRIVKAIENTLNALAKGGELYMGIELPGLEPGGKYEKQLRKQGIETEQIGSGSFLFRRQYNNEIALNNLDNIR